MQNPLSYLWQVKDAFNGFANKISCGGIPRAWSSLVRKESWVADNIFIQQRLFCKSIFFNFI